MKKLGLLLPLLVLATAAYGATATITIERGDNWLAPPLIPFNPDPVAIFGSYLNYGIARWDDPGQSVVVYDEFDPASYGGVLLGDGIYTNNTSGSVVIKQYDGVPRSYLSDVWISLPGSTGPVNGGDHWVGHPFDADVNFSDLLVTDGTQTITIVQAANNGWIDRTWTAYYSGSIVVVGPEDEFPDYTVLQSGHMYYFKTYRDNLALIVPKPA